MLTNKKPVVKERLQLSEYELNQSGIIALVGFLEDRLAAHRIANDNVDSDPLLRGRIAELKFLLKRFNLNTTKIVGASHPALRNEG